MLRHTLAFALVFLAACSAEQVDWTTIESVKGDAARSALSTWQAGIPAADETTFPYGLHLDLEFKLHDLPQPLGPPVDGFATVSVDLVLFGGDEFRARFGIEIVAPTLDEFILILVDGVGEEMRITQRGLDHPLLASLPSSLRMPGERRAALVASLKSMIPMTHPDGWSRSLSSDRLDLSTWQQAESSVKAQASPFQEVELLRDLLFAMEFGREDGSFQRASVDGSMTAPSSIPLFGKGKAWMEFHLVAVPRMQTLPPIEFGPRDSVLDLGPEFDQGFAAAIAALPLMGHRLQRELDEMEAAEDFSF